MEQNGEYYPCSQVGFDLLRSFLSCRYIRSMELCRPHFVVCNLTDLFVCLQFYFFPTTRNAILLLQTSYLILEETAVCHCRWIDSLDDIIELLSCLTWKTCYMSENFCHSSCFWKAKFICNLEWHWTHETAWNLSCSEYFIKLQF